MNSAGISRKLQVSIIMFFIAMVCYCLSMFISYYIFEARYGSAEMLLITLPAEIIVITLSMFIISRYFSWKEIGFNIPGLSSIFWLSPAFLVVLFGWINLFIYISSIEISSVQWKNFYLAGFMTLAVGFAEEFVFRGIILSSLSERFSPRKAIIFSALLFSSLHSINIIAGLPVLMTLGQVALTFITGFYLASVKLKINSIIPLIIWHWLWDFLSLGSFMLNLTPHPAINIIFIFEIIFGLIIMIQMKKTVIIK